MMKVHIRRKSASHRMVHRKKTIFNVGKTKELIVDLEKRGQRNKVAILTRVNVYTSYMEQRHCFIASAKKVAILFPHLST